MDFEAMRQQALAALDAGDARAAFDHLRPALDYPGPEAARFGEALLVFARIADGMGLPELGARSRAVAAGADDPTLLYELGYDLIEVGLPSFGASVLGRANRIAPGQEGIVCELVAALERAMLSGHACAVLRASPALLDTSFICRYLLAFNTLMTGDLETPRRLLPKLDAAGDRERAHLEATIAGMLARADAVAGVTPLDADDLRGWHFVLNGGVLLHRSPAGPEVMHGRYAFVQDSDELCREGIRRLSIVLETWNIKPPVVYAPPDQGSMALAHAAAAVLGLSVTGWPAGGRAEPGLVVVYDLGTVPRECLQSLAENRPGQVLWQHAGCWTAEAAFAPDLLTFLYQFNTPPWGEQLRGPADGGSQGAQRPVGPGPAAVEAGDRGAAPAPMIVRSAPNTAPPATIGARIAATALAPGAVSDGEALAGLAAAARGALRAAGPRRKQWLGSPVASSRF